MTYVDLNPVRAAMATTPEESDHTSIKHRVKHWKECVDVPSKQKRKGEKNESFQPDNLHQFAGNLLDGRLKGIIYNLEDYLQLIDWTGRQIRDDKVGSIERAAEPILKRLAISPEHWVYLCTTLKVNSRDWSDRCIH